MRFFAPNEVLNILSTLQNAGFEAWCVGGCVRDMLLGKIPNDYDITTNALPPEIKKLFKKTVDTGIKHGTVAVILNGKTYEVTTYRTDGDYLDHRKPEAVSFVSDIKEDLRRRDFTINALAWHPEKDLLDYFGGTADLKNKTLKAVGNPDKRFEEDALRILRLFRFSCRLNFSIEENTLKSALRLAVNLKDISRERIATELFEILLSDFPALSRPLIDCGALEFIGIKKAKLEFLNTFEKDRALRFCAFCIINGIDGKLLLDNLKSDNRLKEHYAFVNEIYKSLPTTKEYYKKYMRDFSVKALTDALKIADTDYSLVEQILQNNEPYLISQLDINGNDLMKLGFYGENIGKQLKILCDLVIKDQGLNKKEILVKLSSKKA